MSAQAYEATARQAAELSAYVDQLAGKLDELSRRTSALIGGSATGEDKAMIGMVSDISQRLASAAHSFQDASRTAHRAAREAAEAEQARRRATQTRYR